ncbi:MAG: class I SAM-dependent methyltransferase [Deltaproteobacteria bacterium]|nr:class I SAM-dependent methyltransferase [Deltaproteobacteria bacterium]
MLDGLFVTPAVTAITEALASARADGKIVVIGNAKLAAALGESAQREVIAVGMSPRAAKKLANTLADTSSLEAGSLDAVIGIDVSTNPQWDATLREWARVVRDGGAVVMVDRGHAPEASRRALCAGFTEIEQRHAGRNVVTSGLVTHL